MLASAFQEFVRPADIGLRWAVGAPEPHLLQSERRAFLAFYLSEPAGDAHGGSANVGDMASNQHDAIGITDWVGCAGAVLGGPNDEAYHGHRLWRQGLSEVGRYGAAEVVRSAWIAQLEKSNRVHPSHSPAVFARLHHFILGFHDSTFECVAVGFRAFRVQAPMAEVLSTLSSMLDEGADLPFLEVKRA